MVPMRTADGIGLRAELLNAARISNTSNRLMSRRCRRPGVRQLFNRVADPTLFTVDSSVPAPGGWPTDLL
jgi:hypothetical protein